MRDLVDTDFGRADLTGARLAKVELDGANFRGATGVARSRDWTRPATATRHFSMRQ